MTKNVRNDLALIASSLTINNVTINTSGNTTYTLTLPTSAGSSGQVLTTDGSGVLSWSSGIPSGATGTNLTLSGTLTAATVNVTGLTASRAVATDASKNLVSVANTGTGSNVLATFPTITNLIVNSASESVLVLNASNNSTGFTNLITDFTAPNTPATGRAILRHGRDLSTGNSVQHQFQYEGDNNVLNRLEIGVTSLISASRFEIVNNAATPFRFLNPSGPVSFTGNLNVGGLTASQALATDASKNLVSVANTGTGSNVLATSPTLVTPVLGAASGTSLNLSGLTASQSIFTDASKNLVSVATNGTGNVVLTTSPTLVTPNIGAATGTSLVTSGGVTGSSLLASNGTTITTNVTNDLSLALSSSNSTTIADIETFKTSNSTLKQTLALNRFGGPVSLAEGGGLVSVGSGGLNISNLTASSAVATDASKNLVSVTNTGTGSNVLATSPTLVTPNLGVASATSLATNSLLPSSSLVVGLANSAFLTLGAGVSTNLCLNITSGADFTRIATSSGSTFSSNAATGDTVIRNDSKALHFQTGSGSSCFTISNANVFILRAQPTFITPLSVANGGTGSNTSTGSGALVLATSPTLVTPNIGNATGIGLNITGNIISSAPLWGGKFQTASQNVSSGGDTIAQDLTTNLGLNVAPGLTGSATGYQNLTGRTVTISFTYSVFWDPAIGSGVVQAGVMKNGGLLNTYGGSAAEVFSTTYFTSCTGSGIVELANGDFIELRIKNNLGGVLAIRGTNVGTNFISATQLFYTILN